MTASGNAELIAQLRETIRARGPIPFAEFMEAALYHPAHGYYSSGRARLGRGGDYFTNVSVGPLFGRMLAAQFREMRERLDRPNEFKIVEQGAHGGDFARDVLERLPAQRYLIVEPSPILRARQAETLRAFDGQVEWCATLDELPPFSGVHFSNELIDSMPVHLVKWNGRDWLARHVDATERGFELVDRPIVDPRTAARVRQIPLPSPVGYETEINLAANDWIEALAPKLMQGFVVIVDYGFAREEFYAPHRSRGTLQSYASHTVLASPFARIGEADLSAHVEWTSLIEAAECAGLTSAGFADQHHFLTGLLSDDLARELARDPKTARQLQTLLQPGFLGMKFQFLILAKNIAAPASLRGLRFARG
ncbi:MAG: SAM-dependent methyltransferase [Verrucomicrobiota bacterium]|nr:SAM-dependent methyltransferase [Verrucomicrobiota bacterium]